MSMHEVRGIAACRVASCFNERESADIDFEKVSPLVPP